jgi:hypothetical protein
LGNGLLRKSTLWIAGFVSILTLIQAFFLKDGRSVLNELQGLLPHSFFLGYLTVAHVLTMIIVATILYQLRAHWLKHPFFLKKTHQALFKKNKLILILFAVLLLAQLVVLDEKRVINYPREEWDEIFAFNISMNLNKQPFEYGFVDTYQQILANIYYKTFDSVGRSHSLQSYNNMRLLSKNKFGDVANNDRGITDRYSIFLSRKIHLYASMGLLFLLGYYLLYQFGASAFPFLIMILAFVQIPIFQEQVYQSLPNAQVTVIAGWLTTFLFLFITKNKSKYLMYAYLTYLTGLNIKIDILLYLAPIGLLFLIQEYDRLKKSKKKINIENGLKLIKTYLPFISIFFSVTILLLVSLNPKLFLRPLDFFLIQWHEITLHSSVPVNFNRNFSALIDFYKNNFYYFAVLPVFVLLSGLISKKNLLTLCFLLVIPLLGQWLIATKAEPLYLRYYMTSMLSIYLVFGAALFLLTQSKPKILQILSYVVCAVIAMGLLWNSAQSLKGWGHYYREAKSMQGFAPNISRNQAADQVIQLIKQNPQRYETTVLVDQHAFIDVRRLLLNKIEYRFINIDNYQEILNSPSAKRRLVLFCPLGLEQLSPDYYRYGDYQNYARTLGRYPKLFEYGRKGSHLRAIDESPIGTDHETYIIEIR